MPAVHGMCARPPGWGSSPLARLMPAVPPVLPGLEALFSARLLVYNPIDQAGNGVAYACPANGCVPAHLAKVGGTSALLAFWLCSRRQAGDGCPLPLRGSCCGPIHLTGGWRIPMPARLMVCAPTRQAGNGVTYAHLFHGYAPARLTR